MKFLKLKHKGGIVNYIRIDGVVSIYDGFDKDNKPIITIGYENGSQFTMEFNSGNQKVDYMKIITNNIEVIDPDIQSRSLEDMNCENTHREPLLDTRSVNCLNLAGIFTVEDLINFRFSKYKNSEESLMMLPDLGKKSLQRIKDFMEFHGLEFKYK